MGRAASSPRILETFREGVFNLLRYLGIISGKLRTQPVERHLYGDGDIDRGVAAGQRGFLMTLVSLFQRVRAGERLGYLCDLLGKTIENYPAPSDGVVAMVRAFPVVEQGESLFLLADLLEDVPHAG